MNLAELIVFVGSENVKVQRVDSCMRSARTNSKGVTTLELITDQVNAIEYQEGMSPPKMHGLLIWLPRDKLPVRNDGT